MADITLTDEQKNLVQQMDKLIAANGGKIEHDLADPLHRDYVKLMHNLAGNDEKNFPGLHKLIDEAGTKAPAPSPKSLGADAATIPTTGWETAFSIPEVGTARGTNLAAANGYGTVLGGFQTCNLSLLVKDANGAFIANGSNAAQAPFNSLAVGTNNSTAKAATTGMTAQMTYTYQPKGGGQAVISTVTAVPPAALADPTVTEPKQENGNTNPYNPNAICIGLGRPNDLTRCDYIYNEPTENNPVGRVPLVGSVAFTQPIQTLQPGTNFLIDIYVIRTDTGGQSTQLDPTDMDNVYQNFQIDPSDPTGKTLSWNLPMKANVTNPPSPEPAYNPVVFSNIPWATEMVSYLTVNITVTLDNGTTQGASVTVIIQSSDAPDGDPLDGIAYIKPVEFVWHCLGDDTQVTLPDSSLKSITAFAADDEVKTENGVGTVSVTHVGTHTDSVLKIETDGGHSLVTSTHHVIMTPEGGKHAHLLGVGDKVTTLEGSSKVTNVTKLPPESRNLWNLSLGQAPRIDDPNSEVSSFFANGILVGDARAERAMRYACAGDIDWVKANVDDSFHKDVESTFEMRKKGHANRMIC